VTEPSTVGQAVGLPLARYVPQPGPPAGPASTRPVRIAFISSHAFHGGAELQLKSIIEGLGPEWVASVISLADGPFVRLLREHGHAPIVVPAPRRLGILASAWRLRRLLLRQRPDLVHANGVKAALVAVIATAGTGAPVTWLKVDYARDGWLARLIAARCRQVIGVSSAVTETFRGRLRRKVRVVHCGLPDRRIEPGDGRALALRLVGSEQEVPVVGHVGRFFHAKGQLELVEITPRLLAARPDLRVLIVGAGEEHVSEREYAGLVRARVRELGLERSITVSSNRAALAHDDAMRVVSGCDVVAVPSMPDPESGWREGFGLVGAEALSVGTPVVAYADGSLPEVLGDCAALVPTGDRAALAEAILSVLADPQLRQRLVRCGLARARHFRIEEAVAGMAACYREAAAR
jgi:glycosyltransferase involved in cell wall biosynthesis